MNFDLYKRVFTLALNSVNTKHPTEIYVPLLHYPAGIKIKISGGHWDYDEKQQVLYWWHSAADGGEHSITISDVRSS
jgi:hypothetical protein